MALPKYNRILLKLSGEAMAGEGSFGIDVHTADDLAQTVKSIHDMGVEIAIVIGAGNLWRGKEGLIMAWIAPLPITWVCWPP